MFLGRPTTKCSTSYNSTSSFTRCQPNSSFSSSIGMISIPCAVHPIGSLTAIPTVFEPTSKPIMRITSRPHDFQDKSESRLLRFHRVHGDESSFLHHDNEEYMQDLLKASTQQFD